MTSAARLGDRERPIQVDERSGVLHPQNLQRYAARWFDPDPDIGSVVDQYWQVRWRLPDGESIDQRIIDLPAVTLTIEEGDVPAPLVVTGLHGRAWKRRITTAGSVFAIRLRPAGLLLANAIMDELTSSIRSRTDVSLAEKLGVSERTIQRALKATLGRGPKWISRRIRLQEVARVLASGNTYDLRAVASELGYSDQAHLTSDFRNTSGTTPAAYLRSMQAITGTEFPDR